MNRKPAHTDRIAERVLVWTDRDEAAVGHRSLSGTRRP